MLSNHDLNNYNKHIDSNPTIALLLVIELDENIVLGAGAVVTKSFVSGSAIGAVPPN